MALLTKQQAAEILGVTTGTLDSWRWNGRGPTFVALSYKSVRYDEDAIRDFIAASTRRPSVQAFMEDRRVSLQKA